jgi:hypothetical protein
MRRPARLAAALLAWALATSLGSGAASAQTLPLTLSWSAPPQCPTAEEVRREVVRQAHVVPGRTPPPLDADARVEPVGQRWRVELRTTRAGIDGYQTLEDESCELLARATALVLALALYDPGEAAPRPPSAPDTPRVEPAPRRRPSPAEGQATLAAEPAPAPVEPSPAPPPPRSPDLAPSSPPSVAVTPAPTPQRSVAWGLAADARVSRGPLPETNLGLSLGIDARRGRWLARLRLVGGPATEQTSAAAPDVQGRYQAWGASVGACIVGRPESRLSLAACAELDASLLVGSSSGAARDGTTYAPWYAAGPAALARIRVSRRTRLELGAGLAVSLDRPRFALRHLGDVYEVPRLAPSATAGVSVDL